jgi:hypothetical protein
VLDLEAPLITLSTGAPRFINDRLGQAYDKDACGAAQTGLDNFAHHRSTFNFY